ncbi:iron chelate uptake ABC transporter family permease subunit [Propioniciclava coleopterorum]|uniref:Iron chelate uptake ABC transporter family permease subunit n=1 Tax=Propioniciclava coleopterorum TaxID=2714937 RepID=A0A6G7YAJ4_9ACTN|nr:iron chelate uptake ABC transporter family permease subunit [Propioniciclava coleopterorum]
MVADARVRPLARHRPRPAPPAGRPPVAPVALGLAVLLLISMVIALGIGSVQVPWTDVVAVIARRLRLIEGAGVTALQDDIVWRLRAPRVLGAACVGAVLAVCGAVLQSLTGNELADPYLLGVSSGASVGAVFVLVFGVGVLAPQSLLMMAASFAGALAALAIVLALARGRSGDLPASRTILAGVAVGQLCGALTSLMIMVFGHNTAARSAMEWMLGTMAGLRWPTTSITLVLAAAVLALTLGHARTLDAFSFGESAAASLGVAVNRARWTLMLGTALAAAGTVAFVGPIGFVGLTVPHIVRFLVGARHAVLLPLSAAAGAILLIWSDTAARSLTSSEIPIGIVTAVVGTPVLIHLLRRRARA